MTPETILSHFFDFDNFEIKSEGAMLEFVPERWKGEVATFDIKGRDGNVIVEKDKRVNAKHLRELEAAKVSYISVPEEFLIGRVLARNVVNPETGEVLASANDEISESLMSDLRDAGIKARAVFRISEGRPNALDLILDSEVQWIVNVPAGAKPAKDEVIMRTEAIRRGLPITTTVRGLQSAVDGIKRLRTLKRCEVLSLQEYNRKASHTHRTGE